MSSDRRSTLFSAARAVLDGAAVRISQLGADQASRPGPVRVLRLGRDLEAARARQAARCPTALRRKDGENARLARRRGHFGMRERGVQSPTGSSPLRRSLTALLAAESGYRGMPRNPDKPGYFSNHGLGEVHDDDLSAWVKARLRLALWPHDAVADLDTIETDVLRHLLPPLNLDKVVTPWRNQVTAGASSLPPRHGPGDRRKDRGCQASRGALGLRRGSHSRFGGDLLNRVFRLLGARTCRPARGCTPESDCRRASWPARIRS